MGGTQKQPQGRRSTIMLIMILLLGTFASEYYLKNSSLSFPLIASCLISASFTAWGIPKLQKLKFKQIIREEGPKKHHTKAGTPTMGGLFIVPIGLIIGNLMSISRINNLQLLAISLLTLSFMLIGGLDDWRSLKFQTNAGLNAKGKIILQAIPSLLFLSWAGWQEWINPKIYLFSENYINVGIFIWPIALFVLLAESNATNLTDGLDGLASGCGALVFAGLAIELMLRGNESDGAIASFCMAMAGAWLGFLMHNRKPSKIFMGDTGSLPMGAALCGIALVTNSLWALFIMGGVFVAESVSVIIQVWTFKITKIFYGEGKRIFKMAPIHHHYELKGIPEQVIVNNFWLLTLCLVLVGLLFRSNT